ncbi:hypothetical protein ACFLX5_02320 [Chloroflexota bacterium]
MTKYNVLYTFVPNSGDNRRRTEILKGITKACSEDTYCIASWVSCVDGKGACLWEAPSEQAIKEALAKAVDIRVGEIYPVEVIDWSDIICK